MRARLSDGLREHLLRHAEFVDQSRVALCLLDRIEVGPLQVLDQRGGHRLDVGQRPNQRRNLMQPGRGCGPPPPLARDDLVVVRLVRMRPDQ
jgi:hypothetical protein